MGAVRRVGEVLSGERYRTLTEIVGAHNSSRDVVKGLRFKFGFTH